MTIMYYRVLFSALIGFLLIPAAAWSGPVRQVEVNAHLPAEVSQEQFQSMKWSPILADSSYIGIRLIFVPETSPYYCMGLRGGDLIRRINGETVLKQGETPVNRLAQPRSIQTMIIERGGELFQLQFTHASRPDQCFVLQFPREADSFIEVSDLVPLEPAHPDNPINEKTGLRYPDSSI